MKKYVTLKRIGLFNCTGQCVSRRSTSRSNDLAALWTMSLARPLRFLSKTFHFLDTKHNLTETSSRSESRSQRQEPPSETFRPKV